MDFGGAGYTSRKIRLPLRTYITYTDIRGCRERRASGFEPHKCTDSAESRANISDVREAAGTRDWSVVRGAFARSDRIEIEAIAYNSRTFKDQPRHDFQLHFDAVIARV